MHTQRRVPLHPKIPELQRGGSFCPLLHVHIKTSMPISFCTPPIITRTSAHLDSPNCIIDSRCFTTISAQSYLRLSLDKRPTQKPVVHWVFGAQSCRHDGTAQHGATLQLVFCICTCRNLLASGLAFRLCKKEPKFCYLGACI